MGLTKEVRDFFTKRITTVLDKRIKEAFLPVDEDKVMKEAALRFCKKWGISPKDLERWLEIQAEQKRLKQEEEDIQESVRSILSTAGGRYTYYGSPVDGVEQAARAQFRNEVLGEMYPEVLPQVERLENIKDDIHSVVLLATTETKLVQRLTSVLNKYGGDITELLQFIPEQ